MEHAKAMAVLIFFWYAFVAQVLAPIFGKVQAIPLSIAVAAFNFYLVPIELTFGFVTTFINVSLAILALSTREKAWKGMAPHYTASTIIIIGPITMACWGEGLLCDDFLVHVGGHFWYDMMTPISMTIYYIYLKM